MPVARFEREWAKSAILPQEPDSNRRPSGYERLQLGIHEIHGLSVFRRYAAHLRKCNSFLSNHIIVFDFPFPKRWLNGGWYGGSDGGVSVGQ